VNFRLLGWIDTELTKLREMGDVIAEGTGMPIPANYPVLGRDAFRTATGVHAAAVIKAKRKGDDWLANRVYSGVPAELFGCEQVIEIGPMSGESNVIFWLEEHSIEPKPDLVKQVLAAAKQRNGLLSEADVMQVVDGASPKAARLAKRN
jgi:2-isopropylmalate synthase